MGFLSWLADNALGLITGASKASSQMAATNATNKANLEIADKTNQTNMAIAQQNNEYNRQQFEDQLAYNYAMWQKTNDWNLEQWNRENEYNSASSQRKRLEDAGINPMLAMSGSNSGTASSITSSQPSTPTPQPGTVPNIVAPTLDYSGYGNAVSSFVGDIYNNLMMKAQLSNIEQDTIAKSIENGVRKQMLLADLKGKRLDNEQRAITRDLQKKNLASFDALFDADLKIKNQTLANMELQFEAETIQKSLQLKELKAFDQRFAVEMSTAAADIAERYSRVKLNGYTMRKISSDIRKNLYDVSESVSRTRLNNSQRKRINTLVDAEHDLIMEQIATQQFNRIKDTSSGILDFLNYLEPPYTKGTKTSSPKPRSRYMLK